MTKVIAVFDIGKTNKKILLFNEQFKVVYINEQKFTTTTDDEGFECDDIDLIEKWVTQTINELAKNELYEVQAINFATYGASILFLDKQGKRMAPLYNYLKEVTDSFQNSLFDKYGGKNEFCRCTATPALGVLLNYGIQILWYKTTHHDKFNQLGGILTFAQYLSYLFTQKKVIDSTYLGCHSFLWDYDKNNYHQWLVDEQIMFPAPIDSKTTFPVRIQNKDIRFGIGLHDSSAALVPYYLTVKEKFVLMSTGTWCVSMNPFNSEPITAEESANHCLNFMSIDRRPVKSTIFIMGQIHDANVDYLQRKYCVDEKAYKKVIYNEKLAHQILDENRRVFFVDGIPENNIDKKANLSQFTSFDEIYHQFIYDLTLQSIKYLKITFPKKGNVDTIIVSGGFARNVIMMNYLSQLFSDKRVCTSEVDNASALGAAMVCVQDLPDSNFENIDLKLQEW